MTGKTWDVMCRDLPRAAAPDLPGRRGLPFARSSRARAELMRHAPDLTAQTLTHDLLAASRSDGRRHLPTLPCPTCLIIAEENNATHRGAALMAAALPKIARYDLAGGHLLHIYNPAGVRRSIDAFLKSHAG